MHHFVALMEAKGSLKKAGMNFEEAKKILGLNGTLTPQVIRQAFRRMALQYHPDRYQTFTEKAWATRQFIKIQEARDLLMDGIVYGDLSEEVFQEKDSFYEDSNTPNPSAYSKLRSLPIIRWYLFLLEQSEKLAHPFGQILDTIITIPFVIFGLPLFLYFCFIFLLTAVLKEHGIQGYSDSPTKRGRFVYLLIITLPSIPFLFTLPLIPFDLPNVYFFGPIFLLVLIEWISFFLTEIWRRSIEGDLQRFLPAKRQK